MHLAYGLFVVRIEQLQGFDGRHLRRDAVVVPTVLGLVGVEIASRFLAIYGVFLETLQQIVGFFNVLILCHYHCRHSLFVDTVGSVLLRCKVDEVGIVALFRCRELAVGNGTGVMVVQSHVARTQVLASFGLKLLQIGHFTSHFLGQISEGAVGDKSCLLLIANHCVEPNKRCQHRNGDVWAGIHALPPYEGAVVGLQALQFRHGISAAIVDERLVEERRKHSFLLAFTLRLKKPGSLFEHHLLQFAVLFQTALQRSLIILLILPQLHHFPNGFR